MQTQGRGHHEDEGDVSTKDHEHDHDDEDHQDMWMRERSQCLEMTLHRTMVRKGHHSRLMGMMSMMWVMAHGVHGGGDGLT
jgi:hypothetical protein